MSAELPPVDDAAIARAAEIIARGGIVCVPTETTYGLAVACEDPDALARLSALTGRPAGAAFGLIVPNVQVARGLARVFPERAEELALHWPAPLTLVVPARSDLPPEIVGPGGGVGVRVSPHPWAAALASAVGSAITATSANPSSQPPATTVDGARAYFGQCVDCYLDAGPSSDAGASTLVAVSEEGAITILRRGAFDPDIV